ncbi:MAG: insulinase family protein [Muribaculaceae bacterium]|nr:insulinase family protein [Muribaculaceae bacterium]
MINYTVEKLDNGLTVVNNYDPTTVMAAVTVIYNVGSRDESPQLTGIAHLFEHLMFGGSANIPDFDGAIERAGGSNNAWTSNDFTCFYDVAPAVNIETLFWLESDRMLSPAFSTKNLETQRSVVIEEFKQVCLNKPYGDLMHRLRSLLYKTHPYRYPTIGATPDHIRNATADDVKRFFFSHYAPNNAVLAISGNVTDEAAFAMARRWFGDIPRRDIAPRLYAPEKPLTSPIVDRMSGNVPNTMVVRAFPMPGRGEEGYTECDLITDLLSKGRSSRFFRRLMLETDIFLEADASIIGSEEPGFILVSGRLADGDDTTVKAAIDAIDRELEAIAAGDFTDHDLERVKNSFESSFLFGTYGCVAKSQQLAINVMQGDELNNIVDRYRAVTRDDVIAAARRYLGAPGNVTLIYEPQNAGDR